MAYVSRIDNIGGDGVGVVSNIVQLFTVSGLSTKVLTASFKNVQQVQDVALAGAHAEKMAPDLLDLAVKHPLTDSGVARFNADWASAFGADVTTLDLASVKDILTTESAEGRHDLAAGDNTRPSRRPRVEREIEPPLHLNFDR